VIIIGEERHPAGRGLIYTVQEEKRELKLLVDDIFVVTDDVDFEAPRQRPTTPEIPIEIVVVLLLLLLLYWTFIEFVFFFSFPPSGLFFLFRSFVEFQICRSTAHQFSHKCFNSLVAVSKLSICIYLQVQIGKVTLQKFTVIK